MDVPSATWLIFSRVRVTNKLRGFSPQRRGDTERERERVRLDAEQEGVTQSENEERGLESGKTDSFPRSADLCLSVPLRW